MIEIKVTISSGANEYREGIVLHEGNGVDVLDKRLSMFFASINRAAHLLFERHAAAAAKREGTGT